MRAWLSSRLLANAQLEILIALFLFLGWTEQKNVYFFSSFSYLLTHEILLEPHMYFLFCLLLVCVSYQMELNSIYLVMLVYSLRIQLFHIQFSMIVRMS